MLDGLEGGAPVHGPHGQLSLERCELFLHGGGRVWVRRSQHCLEMSEAVDEKCGRGGGVGLVGGEPLGAFGEIDVRLVGDKDLPRLLRKYPLPGWFGELPTITKSDLARTLLLAEHGGLYLDTDVLVRKRTSGTGSFVASPGLLPLKPRMSLPRAQDSEIL